MHNTEPSFQSSAARWSRLVASVGEESFGAELLKVLSSVCGAQYCSVYDLSGSAARAVTTVSLSEERDDMAQRQAALYLERQLWLQDPMLARAQALLGEAPVSLVRTAVRELPDDAYRELLYSRTQVRDRVLMCARSAAGTISLSMLRTEAAGDYSQADLVQLHETCSLLMAIIDKHVSIASTEEEGAAPLRSLKSIEHCLLDAATPLSRREEQVCARVLYGMTTAGVALDLEVGEETVMTYRKRAYQRLQIGSQRELLLWYLNLWQAQRARRRRRLQ